MKFQNLRTMAIAMTISIIFFIAQFIFYSKQSRFKGKRTYERCISELQGFHMKFI